MQNDNFNENFWSAIILTSISGLSTGIGGLIISLYGKEPSNAALGHMLSFSSGVMIFISFMDLMPDSVAEVGYFNANIWFFIGMLFFAFITYFVPEPDASTLIRKEKESNPSGKSQLMKAGIITALGISLHNFPEGIAVYLICLRGLEMGLPLAFAIAAHNIPEGMAVAAPIYASTKSKSKALFWATISGICEPVGAIIVGALFTQYLTPYVVQCSLASGIMVYLCIRELIPTTLKYLSPEEAIKSHVVGMSVIFISVYYLNRLLGKAV